MQDYQRQFIELAIASKVLRFGQFTLKSGRVSPYFFNAGLFNTGRSVATLGRCYADAIVAAGLRFDMLFGPAYKGITLASATAVALAARGRNVGFSYNRKEAKDHGEGGTLVGAPLSGRVAIIDDVISAGTSVRESVDLIRHAGAQPEAVLIALDRQERGGTAEYPTESSAVQEVHALFGIPVVSIACLDDVLAFLESASGGAASLAQYRDKVAQYRAMYGVSGEPR